VVVVAVPADDVRREPVEEPPPIEQAVSSRVAAMAILDDKSMVFPGSSLPY
jgi:hypothetical protein